VPINHVGPNLAPFEHIWGLGKKARMSSMLRGKHCREGERDGKMELEAVPKNMWQAEAQAYLQ